MVRYWVVKMRPDKEKEPDSDFWELTEDDLIAIGWSQLGDTTKSSEYELVEMLKAYWPKKSERQISTAKSTIFRFIYKIQIKDIVMVPIYPDFIHLEYYLTGTVESRAQYKEYHKVVTRDVRWLTRIPRNRLSESFKSSLNGQLTVFNIDGHREEINRWIGKTI